MVHERGLGVSELRNLARRFGLSAYDASYLALGLELRLPIACGDRPLRAAPRPAGPAGNEAFWEHDLRAASASAAESDERARELLDHEDLRTTRRSYRRGVQKVRPLR